MMTEKNATTEKTIFDAAAQVFEEKGLDGARMQEIADRAGINKALLHYYFRSKEKLFDAVFNKLARDMLNKLFVCLGQDLPLEDQLVLFYKEHIGFLQQHPGIPAFLLNEINKNPQRVIQFINAEQFELLRQHFFKQIDKEIAAGRIEEVDKIQFLANIIGLSVFPFAARGLLEMILDQHNVNFDEFIEKRKTELAQFVMKAVAKK